MIALAILLQVGLLLAQSHLPLKMQVQIALVGVSLAALAQQLWHSRRHWSPHLDMLLLMGAFGGLGMVLAGIPEWGLPPCHRESSAAVIRMYALMWLGGIIPSLFWSRCLQQARRDGHAALFVTLDTLGMCIGMYAAHYAAARWSLPLHYAAMSAGMLLGMGMAMQTRPWAARLTPQLLRQAPHGNNSVTVRG